MLKKNSSFGFVSRAEYFAMRRLASQRIEVGR